MNLSIMWHQIIPLLISFSVFFSCEEAPVEEVLIEEQPECKPLIVNDTLFHNILNGNSYGASSFIYYESIPVSWHLDDASVHYARYKNGCFYFPMEISSYKVDSTRMVWDGKIVNDTATVIVQSFGYITNYPGALKRIFIKPYNIRPIQEIQMGNDCVVRVRYYGRTEYEDESVIMWRERLVNVQFI